MATRSTTPLVVWMVDRVQLKCWIKLFGEGVGFRFHRSGVVWCLLLLAITISVAADLKLARSVAEKDC